MCVFFLNINHTEKIMVKYCIYVIESVPLKWRRQRKQQIEWVFPAKFKRSNLHRKQIFFVEVAKNEQEMKRRTYWWRDDRAACKCLDGTEELIFHINYTFTKSIRTGNRRCNTLFGSIYSFSGRDPVRKFDSATL